MLKSIVDFWTGMEGTVHPSDAEVLARFPDHGFNLDFPPPAYVGDILNAPIIILDNNGGFNERMTPLEFPDEQAHNEYRESLAMPRPIDLTARTVSPYYLSRNYAHLLTSGMAALVNGVAYRSVDGRAKRVGRLTELLPSAKFHRNWLLGAVLPLVEQGKRFLVIHRWSRWNGATEVFHGSSGAVFSSAPISKDLPVSELEAADTFLRKRRL